MPRGSTAAAGSDVLCTPVGEMSYLGHRTLNESDWLPVPELSWKRRSRTRDEKKCCVSISECMWRMHDRNGDGFLSELVKFEGIGGEYQTSAGIEVVYNYSILHRIPDRMAVFVWGFHVGFLVATRRFFGNDWF